MKWKISSQGQVVDSLKALSPECSKEGIRKWIKQGRVAVNNTVIWDATLVLKNHDEVELLPRKEFIHNRHYPDLHILYQDQDIVVVDKPSGLLSVALDKGDAPSAHAMLKRHFPNIILTPVHRLDRETSGILCFAKNEVAAISFKDAFAARDVQKEYLAIVHGRLEEKQGHWEHALFQKKDLSVVLADSAEMGKEALTDYQVLKSTDRLSFLSLKPRTGRKHQLRVQTSLTGHPIVGDKRYGSTFSSARFYLHAYKLTCKHPKTGKPLQLISRLPKDFFHPALTAVIPQSLDPCLKKIG